jgi:hypothetical protein
MPSGVPIHGYGRARLHRSHVRGGVDASGQAGHDRETASHQFSRDPPRAGQAVSAGLPAADHGHASRLGQLPSALVVEKLDGVPGVAQLHRIVAGVVHPHAEPMHAGLFQNPHDLVCALVSFRSVDEIGRQGGGVVRELLCDRLERRAWLEPKGFIRAHLAPWRDRRERGQLVADTRPFARRRRRCLTIFSTTSCAGGGNPGLCSRKRWRPMSMMWFQNLVVSQFDVRSTNSSIDHSRSTTPAAMAGVTKPHRLV